MAWRKKNTAPARMPGDEFLFQYPAFADGNLGDLTDAQHTPKSAAPRQRPPAVRFS